MQLSQHSASPRKRSSLVCSIFQELAPTRKVPWTSALINRWNLSDPGECPRRNSRAVRENVGGMRVVRRADGMRW